MGVAAAPARVDAHGVEQAVDASPSLLNRNLGLVLAYGLEQLSRDLLDRVQRVHGALEHDRYLFPTHGAELVVVELEQVAPVEADSRG